MPTLKSLEYTPELKDKALELAATVGYRAASKQLDVAWQTIQGWAKHPANVERWAELRRNNAPVWRSRAAATMEELVDEYTDLEAHALTKAKGAFDQLEPRDVGNFLRSVAVAKGVTADHVGKLRGQPTHIIEQRADPAQLEKAMMKLLESVDSTAEDITDADAELAPAELPQETT